MRLPFVDFLPETIPYEIFLRGEGLEARLFVPESNTSQALLLALADNARVTNRDGHRLDTPFGQSKLWRQHTRQR